jgi:hypothetical protein
VLASYDRHFYIYISCGRLEVSPGTPVSFTNKTYHNDKTEILLKVTLNTKILTLFSFLFGQNKSFLRSITGFEEWHWTQFMHNRLSVKTAKWIGVRVMVFNTTFNEISVMLWQLVLLVEEIGVARENDWPAASHWQTLSHKAVSSAPRKTDSELQYFSISLNSYIFKL